VWKKEHLHRSILTGFLVCLLSAGLPIVASANESAEAGTTPAAATVDASVVRAAETAALNTPQATSAHSAETAAAARSTVSAEAAAAAALATGSPDLAWIAPAPKLQPADAVEKFATTPHLSSVLHVQKFASGIAARGAAMASRLTRNAMRFLGVPYAFGGTSGYGFDCSGFVQHVFAMAGLRLPRTADAQYYAARRISGAPKAGDLVFFQTYEPGPSHVGISLGGSRFVHASSSHGVMVSTLRDSYWSARYIGAKRIVGAKHPVSKQLAAKHLVAAKAGVEATHTVE